MLDVSNHYIMICSDIYPYIVKHNTPHQRVTLKYKIFFVKVLGFYYQNKTATYNLYNSNSNTYNITSLYRKRIFRCLTHCFPFNSSDHSVEWQWIEKCWKNAEKQPHKPSYIRNQCLNMIMTSNKYILTISFFFSNRVFGIVKIFSWVPRRIKLTYMCLMYAIKC